MNENEERSQAVSNCLSHRPSILFSCYDTDDIAKEKSRCEPVKVHIPLTFTTTTTLSNIAEEIAADDGQRVYGHKEQMPQYKRRDFKSNSKPRNITSTITTKNSETVDSSMRMSGNVLKPEDNNMRLPVSSTSNNVLKPENNMLSPVSSKSDNFLKPEDNIHSPVSNTSDYFSDSGCHDMINDSQGIDTNSICGDHCHSDNLRVSDSDLSTTRTRSGSDPWKSHYNMKKTGEHLRPVKKQPEDMLTAAHPTSNPFASVVPPKIDVTDPSGEIHRVFSSPCQNETVIDIDVCPNEGNRKQELGNALCVECALHRCMTPISTLTNITSQGRPFTDKVNDFSLEIPDGAIPEGMRLTVDVGVALFGPFQFPEGLRPVSPVFWVCVRDHENFEFSKPVTVTIPHFLELENDDDIQSFGLTFLKADHKMSEGQYKFQPLNGKMDFKTSKRFGVLQTTHFCSLCIASRDTAEVLTKTCFCITSVLPRCATLPGKKQYGFFFITLNNLRTCLKRVDEIIADTMQDYHKKEDMFKFKRFVRKPALEILIAQPKHGNIGVEGKTKVFNTLIFITGLLLMHV